MLTLLACADESAESKPIEARVGGALQLLASHSADVKGFEQKATLNLSSFSSSGCSVGNDVESFHTNIGINNLAEVVPGVAIDAANPLLDISLSVHLDDCVIDYQTAVVTGSLELTSISKKEASGRLSLRLEHGLSCAGQETTLSYVWPSFVAPSGSLGCD